MKTLEICAILRTSSRESQWVRGRANDLHGTDIIIVVHSFSGEIGQEQFEVGPKILLVSLCIAPKIHHVSPKREVIRLGDIDNREKFGLLS